MYVLQDLKFSIVPRNNLMIKLIKNSGLIGTVKDAV